MQVSRENPVNGATPKIVFPQPDGGGVWRRGVQMYRPRSPFICKIVENYVVMNLSFVF